MGLGFLEQGWTSPSPFGEVTTFLDMGFNLLNTCHLGLSFLNLGLGFLDIGLNYNQSFTTRWKPPNMDEVV